MEKGSSNTYLKGMCNIVWTMEADLEAGQFLYITGEHSALGSWEPEIAILMSHTEHTNLWKAELEIAGGVNFKYNYFIKREVWPSCDIIWRPGPEFSLSVPLPVKQGGKIVVRDSWMRTTMSPIHPWGSWIEETYLPIQPLFSAPARDEDEKMKYLRSDILKSRPVLSIPMEKGKLDSDSELTENSTHKGLISHSDIIDPFLRDPREDSVYSDGDLIVHPSQRGSISNSFSTERYQPVEEPWLVEPPPFFLVSKDMMGSDMSNNTGNIEDGIANLDNTGNSLTEESNNVIPKEPVSTVILINSSICTMQRIALLEYGKLVELLLEPVKSTVQCDSVYLGAVTKLVPHMGGAFVNIGNSRPSLMDIKHNREPFIFPPFRRTKKTEANSHMFEEHMTANENEHMSLDFEVTDDNMEISSQDDFVKSMHSDDEEHEVDDAFDLSDVKEHMNGSILDYGKVEVDYPEGETSAIPVAINGSSYSQMSHLQNKKNGANTVTNENKWTRVQKGTKVVVQVVKEGLGSKGPTLTAYPKLKSRFWILITRCDRIGISKKISGIERTRLKVIAKTLQPPGFGLTVRTVAAGHSLEELQKDLEGLVSTWKNIMEHAKSAALAADEGVEGAVPVILHRAMGQTLSVVQDYFNETVEKMVVDSPRTYHEVTNYLQEMAPDLCDRVELYSKRIPLFDEFNIEEEINNMLSKRVPLANGGSLVIEQTEALVSVDVNGGHGMFGQGTSQEKAILEVNLAAAKQIARELRLRDIGGIIVVDFIDMADESNKRLVYEEAKKAVERDRSMVKVSELSRHGLMEITRKRVRPSVTFMISEPCTCCHATGRVEALETSFSKIEQEISRLLAMMEQKPDPENPKSWPKFILRVDHHMCDYLTSGKRTRLAVLSSSLKVWILLKVARGFTRGAFEVKPFTDEKAHKDLRQVTISMIRPTEARRTYNPGKKVTLFPVKKWKGGGK